MATVNPVADWGQMLVETDIDRLVIARLRLWLPVYLAQAEVERGLPNHLLARPKPESYENALVETEFPEGRLPAILVTAAQTEGNPERTADGGYLAAWRTTVSAVVRGRTPAETREIASVFGGCVRRCLVQQQLDLDGEIRWRQSHLTPVATSTTRAGIRAAAKDLWLAAAINRFTVFADRVISGDGPVFPTPADSPFPAPDPVGAPDVPYDPLLAVRQGGVTTTIVRRS